MLTLHTAAKPPLLSEEHILLNLRLGKFNFQIGPGVSLTFAINMLLGTYFIDRFIGGIFAARQKVVPKNSQSVFILGGNKKHGDSPTIRIPETEPSTQAQQPTEEKIWTCLEARRIVLKSFTQRPLLVTKTSHSLLTIEPKQISANYNLVAAANGLKDVLAQRPYDIYVSNFLLGLITQTCSNWPDHGTTNSDPCHYYQTPERFLIRDPREVGTSPSNS